MHFEGEEDAEIIDGQVVDRASPPPMEELHGPGPGVTMLNTQQPNSQAQYLPPDVADKILQLATDQRSRALALFVEIPLLGFIAFSPKVPGLLRLGAAGIAVMRAVEVAQRQAELETYLPELP